MMIKDFVKAYVLPKYSVKLSIKIRSAKHLFTLVVTLQFTLHSIAVNMYMALGE